MAGIDGLSKGLLSCLVETDDGAPFLPLKDDRMKLDKFELSIY